MIGTKFQDWGKPKSMMILFGVALQGEPIAFGSWDSSDRLTFVLLRPLTLSLDLDSKIITEAVKFDVAGNASVVGSIEYGDRLQLQLAPGRYGLSLFVEGDLVNYEVKGKFTA